LELCGRQTGKSSASAAMALNCMLLEAPALVLLCSPSQRQSGELFRKVLSFFNALGRPVPVTQQSALQITLANGSRCVSLPGTDDGAIRGYSAPKLVAVDEACRVSAALYYAVRPMLATTKTGRLVCLSSAWGMSGWFFDAWHSQTEPWERVKVTSEECPRIPVEFLQQERIVMGDVVYGAEYLGEFAPMQGCVFSETMIAALSKGNDQPLWSR
jgi:hypothetical protein